MEVPHVQTTALAHSPTNVTVRPLVHTYPWLSCLFSLLAPSSYSDTDLARIVLFGGGMADAVTWNNESNVVTMNCNARSASSGGRRVLFRLCQFVSLSNKHDRSPIDDGSRLVRPSTLIPVESRRRDACARARPRMDALTVQR
jgi:hypothetical protein